MQRTELETVIEEAINPGIKHFISEHGYDLRKGTLSKRIRGNLIGKLTSHNLYEGLIKVKTSELESRLKILEADRKNLKMAHDKLAERLGLKK